jgi:hypothetical protein
VLPLSANLLGPGRTSKQRAWALVVLTLLLQFVLQAYFFPLDELLTAKRLVHIDSVYHQYEMEATAAYCGEGRLTGYDPYFGAGSVSGTTPELSTKLQALAACAMGRADAVAPLYKVFSFFLGVLGPALLVVAAALMGLEASAVAIVALLSLLTWWTGPVRWFHTAGMTSYIAAALLAVPFGAAVVKACTSAAWRWTIAAALCAAVGALLHPLFPVVATLIAVPLIAIQLRDSRAWLRVVVVVALVTAVTLAVNGFWLVPWLTQKRFDIAYATYQRLVDPLLIVHEPLGIAKTTSGGSRLYIALLVAAIPAFAFDQQPQRAQMRALGVAALLLLALASIGSLSETVALLQPNRFSVAAWLALILPAAVGVTVLWDRALRRPATGRYAAIGALAVITFVVAYFVRDASLEVFANRPARYAVTRPEVKGDGATSLEIVELLKRHTDRSARVLFESSLGRIVDGAHVAGFHALAADRELIGGPYPYQGFANAWDDFAFGRRLSGLRTDELVGFLDLYNVRWIACHTAQCAGAAAAVPGANMVARAGPVSLYERPMTPSFFIAGSGSIDSRCFNRVAVTTAAGQDIVLKYHWVDGLVATPDARIEPRFIPGIPRPFIAVRAAPARFAISLGVNDGAACPKGQGR